MESVATSPGGQCSEDERVSEKDDVATRVDHEATGDSESPDTARHATFDRLKSIEKRRENVHTSAATQPTLQGSTTRQDVSWYI